MGQRHNSKIDPTPIITGHMATLVDGQGRRQIRDYVEQFLIPLSGGVVAGLVGVQISTGTGAAILTVTGLFAAFLFQLTIQLLDRGASWSETHPEPGPDTSQYASLLEELSASAGYAGLVAASAAVLALAVSITSDGWPERILAAATIALSLHLGTTLLLVSRRVFLFTRSRLVDARSGSSRNRV